MFSSSQKSLTYSKARLDFEHVGEFRDELDSRGRRPRDEQEHNEEGEAKSDSADVTHSPPLVCVDELDIGGDMKTKKMN